MFLLVAAQLVKGVLMVRCNQSSDPVQMLGRWIREGGGPIYPLGCTRLEDPVGFVAALGVGALPALVPFGPNAFWVRRVPVDREVRGGVVAKLLGQCGALVASGTQAAVLVALRDDPGPGVKRVAAA